MPRKRWLCGLSERNIPTINPGDRDTVEDQYRVRHVLVDFDELAVLSSETREQLVEDLVASIGYARGGVKARKRGVSDKALAKGIYLSDVGRALERVGLPAKRWRRQYDNGGGESFFFRLARELADVFGIALPKDLKLASKRAAEVQYGVMSPAMKAAQDTELAARQRHRFSQLVLRLKAAQDAELAALRQRLSELVLPHEIETTGAVALRLKVVAS